MQNLHNLHVLVDLNQENHVQTFAQLKQKYNKISKQPNDVAEYEQLTAKSSVFPPIWLKNRKCSTPAAQIDLLIERADHLINLCEIKYSQSPYTITKEEELHIRTRMADFVEETGVRHSILPTLITTFGIRPNALSAIAQVQLTMDDLFDDMG